MREFRRVEDHRKGRERERERGEDKEKLSERKTKK